MQTILFSAMRNEGPFILDWVAYHKAIGFDRIVVVSNDCTDGSAELLSALDQAGVIAHVAQTVPRGVAPQSAATDIVNAGGIQRDGDWGIFLDADEYLNIKIGKGRVSDLAAFVAERGAQGMLVNWRVFGDSDQTHFSGSYVNSDVCMCERLSTRTQFKTFFKKGKIATAFSPKLHRCTVEPGAGTLEDFLTGSGQTLSATSRWWAQKRHRLWLENGEESFGHLVANEISYEIAQINHYMVRDPVSFELKVTRGNGGVPKGQKSGRYSERYYAERNTNEVCDSTLSVWESAVNLIKSELLADNAIAHSQSRIEQGYEDFRRSRPVKQQVDAPNFPFTMPEAEQAYVRARYAQAAGVLEYGSGGSTMVAAENGVPCVAVESDRKWAQDLTHELNARFAPSTVPEVIHVDIGPTKAWGYPADNSRAAEYWAYPLKVWQHQIAKTVDTVLIDGRFRKACFASTLLNITQSTTILFDDYQGRRVYHEVEQILKPSRKIGRMAVFEAKPGLIAVEQFPLILPWFSQVK